jgi:hypothetical protein
LVELLIHSVLEVPRLADHFHIVIIQALDSLHIVVTRLLLDFEPFAHLTECASLESPQVFLEPLELVLYFLDCVFICLKLHIDFLTVRASIHVKFAQNFLLNHR